jgi:hypothetical protein
LGFLKNNKVCYNALKFKGVCPKDWDWGSIYKKTIKSKHIQEGYIFYSKKKVGGCKENKIWKEDKE